MSVTQRVFDTAIKNKSICSRAIGTHCAQGSNHLFVQDSNGNLYAGARDSFDFITPVSSINNGFTWTAGTKRYTIEHGSDAPYGPVDALFIEGSSKYILYCSRVSADGGVLYFLVDGTLGYIYGTFQTKYGITYQDLCKNSHYSSCGDGDSFIYVAYVDSFYNLNVIGLDISADADDKLQDYYYDVTTTWTPGYLATKSEGNKVHILGVASSPAPDMLKYAPYYKKFGNGTGHLSGYYQLASGTMASGYSTFRDLGIDVDYNHNICAVYSTVNTSTSISGWYSISNDSGVTWTNVYNAPPAGYSGYVDPQSNLLTGFNDVIGGYSGSFLLSSIYMQNSSGTLFVKEVPSVVVEPTGVGGLRTSTNAWHRVNSIDGKVIGGKFFHYMDEAIPNFGDKSNIRMAYQIGEINSKFGTDNVNSRIYQESLTNLAYPIAYSGTAYTKDNIDFYSSGYINDNTQLYMDKIDELGMVYSFTKYDPIQGSIVNDKGSYGSPITIESQACIDPGSYEYSTVGRNNADFKEYMERDTRKIFYKPNLFLERNYILNNGGYLKRTIWTVRFMGNDYEIAQIVPRFLDGMIVYYEANLYVIGPSNNPFNKVILPNET